MRGYEFKFRPFFFLSPPIPLQLRIFSKIYFDSLFNFFWEMSRGSCMPNETRNTTQTREYSQRGLIIHVAIMPVEKF